MPKFLTQDQLDKLNEQFIRGQDKWYRMYNQSAITVVDYSSENITIRVDSSGKSYLRPSERIPLIKRIEEIFAYPLPFKPPQYTILIYKNIANPGFIIDTKDVKTPLLQKLIGKYKSNSKIVNKEEEPYVTYTGKFVDTENIGMRLKK